MQDRESGAGAASKCNSKKQDQEEHAGAWGKGCAIAGGTPRRHAQEQDAGAGAREMCRDGGQVHVPDAGIRA